MLFFGDNPHLPSEIMSDESIKNERSNKGARAESPPESIGVEPAYADGDRPVRGTERTRPTGVEGGGGAGQSRDAVASVRDNLTDGSRPRVPPAQVDPEDLLRSFETGDPSAVYLEAQKLVQAYQKQSLELAQYRFKVNFGTPICTNCDGLRAGPGIVATCFQRQQCHYSNFKEGDHTPKVGRVLDRLFKKEA